MPKVVSTRECIIELIEKELTLDFLPIVDSVVDKWANSVVKIYGYYDGLRNEDDNYFYSKLEDFKQTAYESFMYFLDSDIDFRRVSMQLSNIFLFEVFQFFQKPESSSLKLAMMTSPTLLQREIASFLISVTELSESNINQFWSEYDRKDNF